ncbi:DUF5305 domain-containing protein [Halobaculum litoreum]|uniref:DUF5305 domain-containing protein n=1 Tax=Halobaculum litoreum TaxID=3031998 RepID=A0ABD5Y118_9EURY
MRERRRLRARSALAEWRGVVLVACLVLAAVGGAGAYTAHVAPGTQTVERPTAEWSTTTAFDHSATVTRENPLFERGTVLAGREAYFTRITPVLNGSSRFSYDAPDGSVDVTLETTLVVRSVDDDGETVYWRRSSPLGSFARSDVPPGRTLRLPFSTNVSAVADRVDRIETVVGGSPGDVEVLIRSTATYEGTVDGEAVRRSRTSTLPVTLSASTYRVDDARGTGQRSASATTSATVPREYGPTRSVGGPLALVVGLVGVGLVARVDPDEVALSQAERERLRFLADRAEYAEWLSRVRPPKRALDRPAAEAESLADLVDFAIDAERGVLAEPDSDPERFHVVDGDDRYVYRAPPRVEAERDGWLSGNEDRTNGEPTAPGDRE